MNFKYQLGHLASLLKFINTLKTTQKKERVTILNYHAIPPEYLSNFKQQINWVSKNYNIISPKEFHDFLENKLTLRGPNIMLTFDDGFFSSYQAIKKVLTPLSIKSLLFIPTEFIQEKRLKEWKEYVAKNIYEGRISLEGVLDYYKPMKYDEVKELLQEGHVIGGHTANHKNLAEIINDKILYSEIINSKRILKDVFDTEIDAIAYPFGSINHISLKPMRLIRDSYKYSYSNIRGSNNKKTLPLAIRRQNITPDIPIHYFRFIVEGGLDRYWSKNLKLLDNMVVNL